MIQAAVLNRGVPALASLLRVSHPTIDRWQRGKNLPHEAMRPSVAKALSEFAPKCTEEKP